MFAGRSIALPVWGCPDRGRDSARRTVERFSKLESGLEELDEMRDVEPDEDPRELVLDPPRDEADPDLPLEDEDGVRDPAGA